MLSHSGRWRIDGDVITHEFTSGKGGEQKRRFQLQPDGTIALTARLEEGTPQARTARLVWRRHEAATKQGKA